eukprot:2530619-Pleurochrysis_carterae.AAC.1
MSSPPKASLSLSFFSLPFSPSFCHSLSALRFPPVSPSASPFPPSLPLRQVLQRRLEATERDSAEAAAYSKVLTCVPTLRFAWGTRGRWEASGGGGRVTITATLRDRDRARLRVRVRIRVRVRAGAGAGAGAGARFRGALSG